MITLAHHTAIARCLLAFSAWLPVHAMHMQTAYICSTLSSDACCSCTVLWKLPCSPTIKNAVFATDAIWCIPTANCCPMFACPVCASVYNDVCHCLLYSFGNMIHRSMTHQNVVLLTQQQTRSHTALCKTLRPGQLFFSSRKTSTLGALVLRATQPVMKLPLALLM